MSRTFVLILYLGLLLSSSYVTDSPWWAYPALLVGYLLWMLLNTRHRLLHDQIAGTVVIRDVNSGSVRTSAAVPDPSLKKLEPVQARVLLDDLDQMRRRARGDLHAASVPLSVLGLLALGGAMANLGDPSPFNFWYWSLAGPIGLFVTAWWFHRLQHRQGAGTGAGSLVMIAIFVTCAAVTAAALPLGGVITGFGFLALAVTQRSRVLGAASVIFGLVAGMEQPFQFISNGIYNRVPGASGVGILEFHGSAVVFGVLGMLLLGAGASVFRRDRLG